MEITKEQLEEIRKGYHEAYKISMKSLPYDKVSEAKFQKIDTGLYKLDKILRGER